MRARRIFTAIDSHTEGMPTRVVTGGVGVLPGGTMQERRVRFENEQDELRRLLMFEPRGHSAMSGAILQPPTRDDADFGVLFIEVSGCLAMCGHGTIGVATTLVETGMVEVTEPVTTIRLDTPAGLVRTDVEVIDGRAIAVTLRNVPSFVERTGVVVDAGEDVGPVNLDVAFGGNFYAFATADSLGLTLAPTNEPTLIDVGLRIIAAADQQLQPVHPEDEAVHGIKHLVITDPVQQPSGGRSAVVIHPGWIDRSPCGTGTSARMALLHAHGQLPLHQDYVHESLIRSRFTGRLVEKTTVDGRPAVIPTIRGRAWITGIGQYLLDPDDPFPAGFLLGAQDVRQQPSPATT